MEDVIKVNAKIAELQAEKGHVWSAAYNSVVLYDVITKTQRTIKTFICRDTGEVREYQHADFE